MARWKERREKFRAIIEGSACVNPASVHDAISGRIAEDLGSFENTPFGSVERLAAMHRTTIVPNDEISRAPLVTVDEVRLGGMVDQSVDDLVTGNAGDPLDVRNDLGRQTQRALTGLRMGVNDGVGHRRPFASILVGDGRPAWVHGA